jgi:hypothetical protein
VKWVPLIPATVTRSADDATVSAHRSLEGRRKRLSASHLLAVSGLAYLAAGLIGCGGSGPNPVRVGGVPLPHVALPPGEWTATGTVLRESNSADEPVGTVLKRPWTFTKICEPSCRTLFLRQTLYGPSETVVIARHGFYTAAFPPVTVPCAHPPGESTGTAQTYARYTLRWSANHEQLLAVEQKRSTSSSCPGTQTNRWVATRTNATAAVPAVGP